MAKVDVVLIVTMTYAFSPGDTGDTYVVFCRGFDPSCHLEGDPPENIMEPGRFALATSSRTTATFTWWINGLAADPQGWTYASYITVYDKSGDKKAAGLNGNTTAVWEMTPSS